MKPYLHLLAPVAAIAVVVVLMWFRVEEVWSEDENDYGWRSLVSPTTVAVLGVLSAGGVCAEFWWSAEAFGGWVPIHLGCAVVWAFALLAVLYLHMVVKDSPA